VTAGRRLAIATLGFRGAGSGTFTTLGDSFVVALEQTNEVSMEQAKEITLPVDFVIALDESPLTVAQLDAFAATAGDEPFEVEAE